jgi:hypothetical protein
MGTTSQRAARRGSTMRATAALLLALATAGCNTSGTPTPISGSPLSSAGGSTIAFESIDGPPVAVFHKLVAGLSSEADARNVAVVSREGPSHYRARGYLAAHVMRGKTQISWVWDIYDNEQRRALRIMGEEAGGKAGRDPWSTADDEMVRRIARASMDRIVALLGSPGVPAPAPAPAEPAGPAVAANAPDATLGLAAGPDVLLAASPVADPR